MWSVTANSTRGSMYYTCIEASLNITSTPVTAAAWQLQEAQQPMMLHLYLGHFEHQLTICHTDSRLQPEDCLGVICNTNTAMWTSSHHVQWLQSRKRNCILYCINKCYWLLWVYYSSVHELSLLTCLQYSCNC